MDTEEEQQEGLQKHTYSSLCDIEAIIEGAIYKEEHRCSNKKVRKGDNEKVIEIITDLKNIHHTDELMYYERYKNLDFVPRNSCRGNN